MLSAEQFNQYNTKIMAQETNLSPGDQRQITANAPTQGYEFAGWTGDTAFLADPTQPTTIVTMGNTDVTVTATYSPVAAVPTKYVATAANGGSDSNTGDLGSPYLTLAQAMASVTTPGYKIHVGAGTFALPSSAHVDLAPGVSLEGEGIDVTYLTATFVSSNRWDAAIRLYSTSFNYQGATLSNFTLTGSAGATRAIAIYKRGNVKIDHVKCQSFKLSAFVFWASDTEYGERPSALISGNSVTYCNIINCSSRPYEADQYLADHIRMNAQEGFIVHSNTFVQTGNSLGDNHDILGMDWGKNIKIYNNTFTKLDSNGTYWHFFAELFHFLGGGEIYGNTFIGNATLDLVDIFQDGLSYGLKVYNNTFQTYSGSHVIYPTTNGNPSLDIETRSAVESLSIYNNVFIKQPNPIWVSITVPSPGEGIPSVITRNVDIHHNEMRDCGAADGGGWGIWFHNYGDDADITTQNISIDNNTIYASSSAETYLWNGIEYKARGTCSSLSIRNNIVRGTQKPIFLSTSYAGTGITTCNVTHNQCHANDTNTITYGTITYGTLNTTNNLTSDPLFTLAPTDLTLTSGSPCRNSGTSTGKSYYGSAPDRGCYEYIE